MWRTLCEEHLAQDGSAFTPPPPAAQLKAYVSAPSYKFLYAALATTGLPPVGLWYRADQESLLEGGMLCVTATGNGQWSWLPVSSRGNALRLTPLALTDSTLTGCAPCKY